MNHESHFISLKRISVKQQLYQNWGSRVETLRYTLKIFFFNLRLQTSSKLSDKMQFVTLKPAFTVNNFLSTVQDTLLKGPIC